MFGAPSDHDQDDAHDDCPDTPPHTPADLRGCPLQPGLAGPSALPPGVRVEIRGYTDAIGSVTYNRDPSRRRAETVRDHLLRQFPALDGSRFTVVGLGESDPVASNATSAGRARNRRVVTIVRGGRGR